MGSKGALFGEEGRNYRDDCGKTEGREEGERFERIGLRSVGWCAAEQKERQSGLALRVDRVRAQVPSKRFRYLKIRNYVGTLQPDPTSTL